MKKTLRKQAHTYSYGIDTHSLRKKISYARNLHSHMESYRRIQNYTKETFIQRIWLRNALTDQQQLFFALYASGRIGRTERYRRKVPNLDATYSTNSARTQKFEHLHSQLQFIFQRV